MKPYAETFYKSKRWQDCRNSYMKKVGGLCELCMKEGKITPAEEVHHKVHLSSQNINEKEPEERYVLINNSGVHTKVILDEIVYAEVFNRKVVIHKLDGEIEYYGKMSDLESLAGDSFFRPHRAYLINFKYVEKYDATTIYLERGTALMAKQNYPEFVKKYMKYIQKRG
mgnify:CR=1 FL=1